MKREKGFSGHKTLLSKPGLSAPERVVELSRYVPDFLMDYAEMRELYKREEEELAGLYREMDERWTDSLAKEAGMTGIKRFESLLGLKPYPGDSLEERRKTILMKWNQQLPYTLPRLREQLDAAVGRDGYQLALRHQVYELELLLIDQTSRVLRNVRDITREMIPANLLFLFAGKYPAEYSVPIHCQESIRFRTEFYPRYNLAFLQLDNTWRLEGEKKLSKYDSDEQLDFYPVSIQFQSGARETAEAETAAVSYVHEACAKTETGAALTLQATAKEPVRTEEAVGVRTSGTADVTTSSRMHKMNCLDGEWKLNGSRKLDGGMYVL